MEPRRGQAEVAEQRESGAIQSDHCADVPVRAPTIHRRIAAIGPLPRPGRACGHPGWHGYDCLCE
jgi:hypothetical protein